MKKMFITVICAAIVSIFSYSQYLTDTPEIQLQVIERDKKVNVLIDGNLFTAYMYHETIKKPVLWPIVSPQENVLTRTYPMGIKEGERTDHPHHIGVWLNHGDVNGLDFWNNSNKVPVDKRNKYGAIFHRSIERAESGKGKAVLSTVCEWATPSNQVLLKEHATFKFYANGNIRIIDRETKLTALADTVLFRDNKEGLFAVRVASELELPAKAKEVEKTDNTKSGGNYLSSEGIAGEDVWGTRGRWMRLSGKINGENLTLVIIDHPDNVGYPTYWHARGYGLFAANPLGESVFSNGKKSLNYRLEKSETLTIKYRLVVISGEITNDGINQLADEFAKVKNIF